MTIAPLIIGEGRPAIACLRPPRWATAFVRRYRVFRMGGDVLFDCDLKAESPTEDGPTVSAQPAVARVI